MQAVAAKNTARIAVKYALVFETETNSDNDSQYHELLFWAGGHGLVLDSGVGISMLDWLVSSEIVEEDISTQGYAEEWNSHSFADLPGMDFLSYSQSSDHMMSVQTTGGMARESDAPTPRQAVEIINSSDEEQSSMITPQQKMKRSTLRHGGRSSSSRAD